MNYPVLHLRIKAMMLDSIVFAVMLFLIMMLSVELGITDTLSRISFIAVPIILFEPVMIWLTGGSVGHHFTGIRIIGKNSGKNLFITNGIVRYLVKMILGIYSLISMFITKQHQSLHDLLSNSVVVFKNEDTALSQHKLGARKTIYKSTKPSIWRRLGVILVCLVIYLILYAIIFSMFVSDACVNANICNASENNISELGGIISIVVFIFIIILGLLAKLPGAYYAKSYDT